MSNSHNIACFNLLFDQNKNEFLKFLVVKGYQTRLDLVNSRLLVNWSSVKRVLYVTISVVKVKSFLCNSVLICFDVKTLLKREI